MKRRKAITHKMKWQALIHREHVLCAICRLRVWVHEPVEWDHVHEVADDGPHTIANLRPLHPHCHRQKTKKATTQRAHIKELEKRRLGKAKKKPKRKWPKRPFPSKRVNPHVDGVIKPA